MDLPTGTVTFLFTDIESSTELWERDEAAARAVLVRHDQIIEELVRDNEGMLVRPRGEGDSRFAVFDQAPGAVRAAASIQGAFVAEAWPTPEPLKIRMGLHTGTADLREGDYYGSAVNRCARVRSLARGGQALLSLATEQLITDHLSEGLEVRDLGVHSLKGLNRPEQIFQLVIPEVPSEFPELQTQVGPKHNLPERLTPFVGRQSEIADVRSLLSQDGIRLVTLKGPGGIGKTRLAIEIAGQELEGFTEGARFVSLAPLDSADQLVQAFLEGLDLRPASGEDPRDFLIQHLQREHLLIVVDNFEHVLDDAPLVTEILEIAPKVKVLTTSRERLGLRGESVFDLTGLEYANWQTVEQALSASCGQLFVQGALQVQRQFELNEADVTHVARICRLVDGAPLALLLSAAWIDVLSVEEIADEVEASLEFLESEMRDAPARQRSLRAVFEASWERLEEPGRELFMRLSVFRGGFTRAAASAVAQADLRSLARLTDKSFLRREPETGRYEIHEQLRQFGERRLSDEATQITRQAHASYFADFLEAQDGPLTSAGRPEVQDEIEADIENIRRAWTYLGEMGDSAALQKSMFTLMLFHEKRGWYHAGVDLFSGVEHLLTQTSQSQDSKVVAAQLKGIEAFYTVILGFPIEGLETAKHSLNWLRQSGHHNDTAYSLTAFAVGNIVLRNMTEAMDAWREMVEVGEAIGSKWWQSNGMGGMAGVAFFTGDVEACERYLEADLQIHTGDPWLKYWNDQLHALLAENRGDLAEAKRIFEMVLDNQRLASYYRGLQYTYRNLARLNALLKEFVEAEHNYIGSLRISYDTGQIRETLANLIDLASVWKSQGRAQAGVRSLASVLHHPEIDQHDLFGEATLREDAEKLRAELDSELEPDQFQAAWQKGSDDEVDDVVIRILAELGTPA